ncbi:DUF5707 domain-containing protein [Streptomyces sp. SID11385]|uniref:DUF5707 domain-containing protein n=1 Tax=Streptomyces sp. SID11385 TaxID=2706031 RepID=UPI0013CA7CFC|nr:DUF5707 domain-containing protein [Streptomyces sp. SID11385]NEA40192.1 hypothetical protein [Streptomyces sp. SID11385]
MSKRLVVSSLVGAAALVAGTVVAVSSADAAVPAKPEISKATAHYTGSATGGSASLVFTATVADNSGVKSLRVLAWPASSKLAPTAGEMRTVEEATCKTTSATTSVCTYSVKSSPKEATALPKGTWYVSALATAKDHDTTFAPKAATFTVKH